MKTCEKCGKPYEPSNINALFRRFCRDCRNEYWAQHYPPHGQEVDARCRKCGQIFEPRYNSSTLYRLYCMPCRAEIRRNFNARKRDGEAGMKGVAFPVMVIGVDPEAPFEKRDHIRRCYMLSMFNWVDFQESLRFGIWDGAEVKFRGALHYVRNGKLEEIK